MSLGNLLFSVSGRASRKHYWLALLAILVIVGAAAGIDAATIDLEAEVAMPWLTIAASVIIIWPTIAIQVKRWHDRNKSAWWILIQLVPVIGPLWALVETGFLPGTPTENRYGAPVA